MMMMTFRIVRMKIDHDCEESDVAIITINKYSERSKFMS